MMSLNKITKNLNHQNGNWEFILLCYAINRLSKTTIIMKKIVNLVMRQFKHKNLI